MEKSFSLVGLDCANCAAQLENKIKKIKGIEGASISFITGKLIIKCNEEKLKEIIKNIRKTIKKEEPDVEIEEL